MNTAKASSVAAWIFNVYIEWNEIICISSIYIYIYKKKNFELILSTIKYFCKFSFYQIFVEKNSNFLLKIDKPFKNCQFTLLITFLILFCHFTVFTFIFIFILGFFNWVFWIFFDWRFISNIFAFFFSFTLKRKRFISCVLNN